MKYVLTLLQIVLAAHFYAQVDSSIVQREDHLRMLLERVRNAQTDAEKEAQNMHFKSELYAVLQLPEAFTHPFSSLKSVGFIDSPDKQIRIVNWNIEQADETQKYYCFILHPHDKKKAILVSELMDNSTELPPKPDGILDANNWYGALYYKIIPFKKNNKTIYTLLGWDGNSSMSTIKLIDALYFTGNKPKLGSPIFKTNDATVKRVFFEHSKKATMSLRYESTYNRIIFDHLSPETPSLKGFYSFYVPDLSYDAFELKSAKWVLVEDVIGVNNKGDDKTSIYVKDPDSGKIEKKVIKNKWISPDDKNSPVDGNKHTATMPDGNPKSKENSKKTTENGKSKDKRDPGNLNATLGKKSKTKKRKKISRKH
jgi:hypothetical protein